ncbi:MAG: flagellar export chaperone FliS [Methylococcaceae bacterium]|nr:flagellar export chaperone FliS [Methylococcaceae bacterium]
MYPNSYRQKAGQYASVQTSSQIEDASPHQLIVMLMEGFLARVNSAKGAIVQKDVEAKNVFINKAIGIIGGLHEALDLEKGGEIAQNLNNLYTYISKRLFQASIENNTEMLDEVAGLMREIKGGWDAIKT